MEKKNIDWENLGFGYIPTDKRYVANYKDGKWDEGALIDDPNIVMNECAGVLQYAQTVFEGMKAYRRPDGSIQFFRPKDNLRRYNKSADRLCIPASMTKLMTLLLVQEAVEAGKVTLQDTVAVSERAYSMGGSQVFLEANASYPVRELIKSVAVCSANDSCVALAERIAGSESLFTDRMNARAKEIGAENTLFANCTGLPREPQYSCARDVAKMLAADGAALVVCPTIAATDAPTSAMSILYSDEGEMNDIVIHVRNPDLVLNSWESPTDEMSAIFGWETDGIFHSYEEIDAYRNADGELLQPLAVPGNIRYKDYNGDGVLDDKDNHFLGRRTAPFRFGLNNTFTWRNWSASFYLYGAAGHTVTTPAQRGGALGGTTPHNTYVNGIEHIWSMANQDGDWPGIGTDKTSTTQRTGGTNDFFLKEIWYIKLRNVSLSYALPRSYAEAIRLSSLAVTLDAENLGYLSNYEGYDPEMRGNYPYPICYSFSIGVRASF